jgi:hypothetical protein
MHLREARPIAAIPCAPAAVAVAAALAVATVAPTAAQAPATTEQGASEGLPSAALLLLFGGPARWPSDADMHRQFLEHFRSAVGLGRSRMFSPSLRVHDDMLLTLTAPSDEDTSAPVTLRYELKALELIGVAKHATPMEMIRACVSWRSQRATRATYFAPSTEAQSNRK